MPSRSDDILAGLLFLGLAAFFGLSALGTLEIGSAGTMGPGYFPVMMAAILAAIAVAIIVKPAIGVSTEEKEPKRPIPWRGLILVCLAPAAFGLTVRSLGMVPGLLITVTLAVLASRTISLARGAAIVVGMTIFCVAVFSYGIGLPAELINSRFLP